MTDLTGSSRYQPSGSRLWIVVSLLCGFGAVAMSQELVTGSTAPNSLAAIDGWVYWGVTPAEQCGAPGVRQGGLFRVHGGGGAEEFLARGCRINPIAIEADDIYVYYLNYLDSTVERSWVGGGGVTILVDNARTGFKPGGLAIDSTHVYWADNLGIRRVSKDGQDVETVVVGVDAQSIAVDSVQIFWTEGSYTFPGSGAIRRVSKTGTRIETVVQGINGPPQIALDSTYLYWTGTNATVSKWPKDASGGSVQLAPGGSGFRVSAITVDDTHVYWSDGAMTGFTGRVRRVAKGGGRIDDLVLGSITLPRSLSLDGAHVYYSAVQSGRGAGIFRLLRDADAVLENLKLVDMEVTQGIQNLSNLVSLVEGKSTLVRVWASAEIAETPNVEVVLHGSRGGAPLSGSPLRAVLPSMTVLRNFQVGEPEREYLGSSFNFFLPDDWTVGPVRLTAELNPSHTIPERAFLDNASVEFATFLATPEVCIITIPVRTRGSGVYGPRSRQFHVGIDRFLTLMPVSEVKVWSQSSDVAELEVCWSDTIIPLPYPCYGPYELSSDGSKILNALSTRDAFTDDPDECPTAVHYLGLVRSGAPPVTKGGLARRPGQYSWVRIKGNTSPLTFSGHPAPSQGILMAHELSHNYAQRHVNCGSPASPDPNYPYCFDECHDTCPCCRIGHLGAREHYGFDFLTQTIFTPGAMRSYMGYADPRWTSDYNWRKVLAARNVLFRAALEIPDGVAAGDQEWLFVFGSVNEDERTGKIELAYRLAPGFLSQSKIDAFVGRQRAHQGGIFDYTLRLVDPRGRPLVTEVFQLSETVDQDPAEGPFDQGFALMVPWHPRTTSVRLVQDGQQVDSRSTGGSAPSVRVLEPNGGEVIGDRLVVRWEASDPDHVGIPLRRIFFTVQYSRDGGRSWEVLTTNVTGRELVIENANDIPGSTNARVRVIATDGLNTAFDASDGSFRVGDRQPVAYILSPENGAVFQAGEQIRVSGSGWDPEDGTLQGSGMRWSIGGTDVTRFGRHAILPGQAPGTYRIRLEGVDSARHRATEEIEIIVEGFGGSQRPGDINQDAMLDISDAIGLLDHLFIGTPAWRFLPCGNGTITDDANVRLLDSNGDRTVDLSDPVYVLQYLFLGGGPPTRGDSCIRISGCPDNAGCR